MIRWVPLYETMRMIDRREVVGAATVVGVYRALLEDLGLVGRAHARIGGPSFTEWLDATCPSRADPAAPSDQQPFGARQASWA
ncbi:hypothetical protein [Nocardia testacea]|uniref:hypothetical protein n=1 Tax=Nocardia testacea TaxID=248551 RepID=UPI00030AD947|nr:hypothetical protein [Nocardia testacea]